MLCGRSLSVASSWWGWEQTILGRYPIELSGGMKQRMVIVHLHAPGTRRCSSPTRSPPPWTCPPRRRSPRRSVEFRNRGLVKSMIVITHDLSILQPGRRLDHGHVCGEARREGVRLPGSSKAPLHPYTHQLIRRFPRSASGSPSSGCPASPAARRRSSIRRPGAVSGPAVPWPTRSAWPSRRSPRSSPATPSPAGRCDGMLTLDRVSKSYRVGMFGGRISRPFVTRASTWMPGRSCR